jgi:putative endonuclease
LDENEERSRLVAQAWLNRLLGSRGERAAARYLKRNKLRILARNVRMSRRGEIDLLARDGETLVFVEVKTRRAGEAAEAITPEKRRRLTRAALEFLRRHELLETSYRFDVVTVTWPNARGRPIIKHYRNAFEPIGTDSLFT